MKKKTNQKAEALKVLRVKNGRRNRRLMGRGIKVKI